ncbi:unnamed protein product [Protopolystoma xenopodis]|uniref:Uncharacterized protein n=1 Tax=Protopolystoma xenopodis TaxID=117903 RepID=A0A448WPK4_9PLAT|nr:unnamed protein product [Protopolystoma xenopodis]
MYVLVVPWSRRAYICVLDSARVNQLPGNLSGLYTRLHRKLLGSTSTCDELDEPTDAPDDLDKLDCGDLSASGADLIGSPPDILNFETRVETDSSLARRVVQRWLTGACQEMGGAIASSDAPGGGAPIVVLLHASSSATTELFEETGTDAQANGIWPLGETMTSRRRTPLLQGLFGLPVVSLGGTAEESASSSLAADDPASGGGCSEETEDAYSLLNWQSTIARRAIKFFLQVYLFPLYFVLIYS